MAWYKVAEAQDLDSLAGAVPEKYQYIPVGKRTRIKVNTSPFPVAPLFDLAGAELAARLLQKGGRLIDVSGEGAFTIVYEIEAVDTASASSDLAGPDGADMAFVQIPVAAWIAIIIGLLLLAPLITKVVQLFANFIPATDGGSSGGSVFDLFKTFFGDYTPYIVIGAVVVGLYLLTSSGRGRGSPIIYNLPSGSRRSEE